MTATGAVSTFAGSGAGCAEGTGLAASFYLPEGVAVAADGTVLIADRLLPRDSPHLPCGGRDHAGRTASRPGTSNGAGDAARFYGPAGLAHEAGLAVSRHAE